MTRAWQLYELGRNYNESLTPNQYTLVETNTEFFTGNQWLRLPNTPAMRGLPKPTFNILKRVASLFIASLTSSGAAIRFEPLAYYDGSNMKDPDHDAAAFANAEVDALLEKFKFDYRIRDALFDGATVGDYCAHFYFDPDKLPYGGAFGSYRGEIEMELLDGINVMFGNPNDRRVQEQPYIIIVGRDTVEHLSWEAKRYKANRESFYKSGKGNDAGDELLDVQFQPDADYDKMPGIGGKTEIVESEMGTGKALYVYLYTKVSHEEDMTDANGNVVYEDVLDANGDIVYEKGEDGELLLDVDGMPVPKRKLYGKQITELNRSVRNMPEGEEKYRIKGQAAALAEEALTFYKQCMSGQIKNPTLTADYSDLPTSLSNELIRLDGLSKDYSFKPGNYTPTKYNDPHKKNYEYILDDEQKDKYKETYREVYAELMEEAMNKEKYRSGTDVEKAEILEATRDDVTEETRDRFLDWLRDNYRSTKKTKK